VDDFGKVLAVFAILGGAYCCDAMRRRLREPREPEPTCVEYRAICSHQGIRRHCNMRACWMEDDHAPQ
jgi:hypothetical protein